MFIHDYFKDRTPLCFDGFYFKMHEVYPIGTRNAKLGCIFKPIKDTTTYGLNSITINSIRNWNDLTKKLRIDLSSLTRKALKKLVIEHILDSYIN